MQKFKNGCRVRTVSLGTGVTLSGTETTYDVSGLTAIGTTALSYNGTIYSGEGQTLTLSHIGTAPTGYSFSGYSATAGTIDGSTFTMPASDVTITALFTENVMNLTDAADNTSVITAEGENPHTVEQGKWTFHGTYKRIDWQESYGRWYGFNAADGVFSHCIDGAYFPGLRCYLVYDPAKTSRGVEDAAPDDAPTVLKVIFNDGNRQTTAIGIIDSKTGEITLDKDCWYGMDGRKLQGKPAKKGLYINNGKKILVGDKR